MSKKGFIERIIGMSKKTKKRLITVSVIAVAVIVLFTITWISGYNNSKNKAQREIDELKAYIEQLEETPIIVEKVTSEIVMGSITESMGDISELSTAEYIFTDVAKYSDNSVSWLPNWVTGKSFILKWDGVIKAGVDLSKMSIVVEESIIKVSLPRAEIFSYETKKTEVMEEKDTIFNPIKITDTVKFNEETAEFMKLRAVGNGLLEKAQTNAEGIIKNIIISSVENIQDYTIEFSVNYN